MGRLIKLQQEFSETQEVDLNGVKSNVKNINQRMDEVIALLNKNGEPPITLQRRNEFDALSNQHILNSSFDHNSKLLEQKLVD